MKNAEVEKIRHWSALVGQLGWSKNSRGHLKLILYCSLPKVIPHRAIANFTQIGRKTKVILMKYFQKSAKATLLELERSARSHWIQNYLDYFNVNLNTPSIQITK